LLFIIDWACHESLLNSGLLPRIIYYISRLYHYSDLMVIAPSL
jgi:hypothetical protein